MGRKSAVEEHEKKREIEQQLIEGETLDDLSTTYGISISALHRHKHKLGAKMAGATTRRRQAKLEAKTEVAVIKHEHKRQEHDREVILEGDELLGKVNEILAKVAKLVNAADDYLTDPDDPTRYSLAPRAEEVIVTIEEEADGGRRVVQRKMTLQDAINRVSGLSVVHVRNASNDPRNLLLSASKALEGQMKLIIEYAAELRAQQHDDVTQHPDFELYVTAVARALEEYPEAREAVEDALANASR